MRSFRFRAVAVLATLALAVTLPAFAPDVPRAAAAAEPKPPAATTFAMPLKAKSYSVVSYFGPRCIPLPGASTYHLGLDMAAPGGHPIYAVAAGVVVATVSGTRAQAGHVKLRHVIDGVTYTSIYYHVWRATTQVKVGQTVAAGQRISEVGNSGVSGGDHLHLELWKGKPGSATAVDPAPFLKARGVDLYGGAKANTAKRAPATCTYYASSPVNFRTGPSTSHSIISTLPTGTKIVHVPGNKTSGFLPVKVGSKSGWVSSDYVTPNKPAVAKTTTTAVKAKAPAVKPKAATYKTKGALNLRTGPSLKKSRILVIPKGANVGSIKASKGVWRKVVYKGKTGWVHSSYLKKR